MEAARTAHEITPLMLLREAFLFIIQHPEYTPQTPRYAVVNPYLKSSLNRPRGLHRSHCLSRGEGLPRSCCLPVKLQALCQRLPNS